ncbi:MAG: AIR carboxylase family protein [Anaerolineae bacterium]
MLVVVIMGSPSDADFSARITGALDGLGIPWETRVASAHKVPRHVLELLDEYEANPAPKVYVTVAGRSNALSGLVDGHVSAPVIACPPYSDKFAGGDLLSSVRMPSGIAPAVVLEPESAALLAAKMLGLAKPHLRQEVLRAQERHAQRLLDADVAAQG